MEPLLEAQHITIQYNQKTVVSDVSFQLREGEILGIVGESGSGKSTIIKAVNGLLGGGGLVSRGDIRFKGRNIIDMPAKERRKLLGPEIGMVQQDCKASFCPVRKIGDQIYESLREHQKISREDADGMIAGMMKKIGLNDTGRILNSYPFELSGGMNQRVGICTAMIMKPSLLLADEPTSALDVTVQKQVIDEMKLMQTEYHAAMIVVTHNIGVVRALADQVLVLKDGAMQDYGPTEHVLEHSENEYTRRLMNSVLHLRREEAHSL